MGGPTCELKGYIPYTCDGGATLNSNGRGEEWLSSKVGEIIYCTHKAVFDLGLVTGAPPVVGGLNGVFSKGLGI